MAKAAAMVLVVALVIVAVAGRGAWAQCNAGNLAPCAPAILGGSQPTPTCCTNLRAQQGCFCQYARNPAYAGYINSQNARRTLAACRVSIPRC